MTLKKRAMDALRRTLFSVPRTHVYAILDGASVPGLPEKLSDGDVEHTCLYRGDMPADLEAAAPYLVRLPKRGAFTDDLLANGWGAHWGVFAVSGADIRALRRHLRSFLMVKHPDGRQLYFRYYDPRVLRSYLSDCPPAHIDALFGPVVQYVVEPGDDTLTALRFRPGDGEVHLEPVSFGDPAAAAPN